MVGKGGGCVGGVALLSSYWCDGKLASTLLWYHETGQYGIKVGASIYVDGEREGAQ